MPEHKTDAAIREAQANLPNIRRIARYISQSENRDKIKQVLTLLFEPSIKQGKPVLQENCVPIAEILTGLDIPTANQQID